MSDAPSPQVICFGELLIDLIASDDSTRLEEVSAFVARAGGAPANAAVALARLSVPSAFCGVVGDDPFGARLRATLISNHVEVSRLRTTRDADTTIAFAWKDAGGDGRFRLLRLADRLLSTDDVEAAGVSNATAIVAGSVALAEEPARGAVVRAIELASEAGVPVCFDVNLRPTMWASLAEAREVCEPVLHQATVLKLSLDDARVLFETDDVDSVQRRLSVYPARFLVLTDGARGAWFAVRRRDEGGPFQAVPAFKVDAIEPTGAGDAFTAALISRLIDNDWETLKTSDVEFASAAGALTTTRRGAMEALPTKDEIQAFLRQASHH